MSIPDWATTVSGAIALLAAIYAIFRFSVSAIVREMKPNGGSSLRDKVDGIEQKVSKLENRVDQIYVILVSAKKD